MKKFLIMLMVVAMASFLFVGCLPGVTPDPDPAEDVAVTGVTLDKATLAFTVGDAPVTLVATVAPADATNPSVIWASIDETVAIVAAGVVTPLNAGISAITVTTVDGGFVATCVVTVTAEGEPPEKTEPPVITSVPGADDGYVNKVEEVDITIVRGYSVDGSIVKLYFDGKLIGTTVASKAKSVYAMFEFLNLDIDLGEEGEKTLYATAQEPENIVSDPSDPYTFILDTTLPKVETVSIDGSVFEDGDFVLFIDTDDEFETLTAEMSEPVSLVEPGEEPVIELWGEDFATFEISEDGLTLTLTPATDCFVSDTVFYTYFAGEMEYFYGEGLVEDAAGNGNKEGSFTLTFVDLTD